MSTESELEELVACKAMESLAMQLEDLLDGRELCHILPVLEETLLIAMVQIGVSKDDAKRDVCDMIDTFFDDAARTCAELKAPTPVKDIVQ